MLLPPPLDILLIRFYYANEVINVFNPIQHHNLIQRDLRHDRVCLGHLIRLSADVLYCTSSCRRTNNVMDSHTTGPGFKTRWIRYTFSELLTDYHHGSIIRLSVRRCVWKVGERFSVGVELKTLKWLVVYISETLHING